MKVQYFAATSQGHELTCLVDDEAPETIAELTAPPAAYTTYSPRNAAMILGFAKEHQIAAKVLAYLERQIAAAEAKLAVLQPPPAEATIAVEPVTP